MFMNASCPACGQKTRVRESSLGQQVKCPACGALFQCGSLSPPSLKTHPVGGEQAAVVKVLPETRASQVQADPSIHYSCPRCAKPLESPAQMAGQKLNCPDCGQRLQIPQPGSSPSVPSPNPTVLATEVPYATAVPQAPPSPVGSGSATSPSGDVVRTGSPVPSAVPPRRDTCLECGTDLTQRPRVPTCPDCGSLFCSASCYRQHRYHAHPLSR
jgi:lysine biosynthesis protein LysW